MRRVISTLIILVAVTFFFASPAISRWWDDSLVTIDGVQYTPEDFKRWWKFWNDTGLALPETPEPYIDWLLLVREGKRMKLDKDPAFQHKTEVFLKFKSLLMLQREEIFDKIKISDSDLWARYEKLYTPIWLLERLQFYDKDTAQTAWQRLRDGTLTIDDLIKLPPEDGGPFQHHEDWRRPIGIHEAWSEIFKKLAVGEASEPIKDLNDYVFYYLKKKEDGSSEDFTKVKKQIQDYISDEMRKNLTLALLSRLEKKFEVKVDRERLAALDLNPNNQAYDDTPVIFTNRRNITEKEFVAILQRDQQYMSAGHQTKEEARQEIINRVAEGIISQNVVDWEALDRHYEEKEPLKWEYQFNYNHRLTTSLANRLFHSKSGVSDGEIEKYYSKNISRFSQPESVEIGVVEDKDGIVDRIWTEVATGKNFFVAVKENTEQDVAVKTIPVMHLDPAVRDILQGLAKGETSRPFMNQGHRFILFLRNRVPAAPIPLQEVSGKIRSKLQQLEIAQQREKYLELLKAGSEIKVNESKWQAVKKEIGEGK